MAVELASAYVTIIPTTKGISAGLERELSPLVGVAGKVGDSSGKALGSSFTGASGGFKSSLEKSAADVGSFGGKATKAFENVKANAGLFAVAGGLAIAGFAASAVGDFTKTAKAALDLSAATGLNVEDASRWIALGDDYEISAETMATSIGKITKTLDTGKWKDYGIATRDAAGHARDANDILLDTFDMLSKIPEGTERATAGNALFGKGYANLAPLIGKSRIEMEKYLGSVEEGQVITAAEAAKAEKFRLAQDALADAFGEVKLAVGELVVSLAPLLEAAAKLIAGFAVIIGQLGRIGDLIKRIPEPPGWLKTGLRIGVGLVTLGASEVLAKVLADTDKVTASTEDLATATARQHQEYTDARVAALDYVDSEALLNEHLEYQAARMAGIKYETDQAKAATDRYVAANALAKRDVTDALDAIQRKWDILSGDISADKSWNNLQLQFIDLKGAHEDLTKQVVDGSLSQAEAMLLEKNQIDDTKQGVIDYATEVLKIPPEALTNVLALIDQGKYDEALAMLDVLSANRIIWLSVQTKGNASPLFGVAKDANGRIIITPSVVTVPGAATGGYHKGWIMAGERGRELIELPQGGYVHTATETSALMATATSTTPVAAGRSGVNVEHLEVHNDVDADGFFRYANFALAST